MRGILLSGAISALLAFLATPALIKILAKKGYGQIIRDDGPTTHQVKRGTPTMGGLSLIAAAVVGYFASHLITGVPPTVSALLVIALILGLGFVGFLDDWLKVAKQRSMGLSAKQKLLGQAIVAGSFAYAGLQFPDKSGLTPISLNLSTVRDTSIKLGLVLVIIWVILMVLGTSNGVNLTDGLDGLAIMPTVMITSALAIFAYVSGNQIYANYLNLPYIAGAGEVAIFCAAIAGSGLGFLWFNAYPAEVFMGDIGSLALGAVMGTIAVIVRQEIVLFIMAGLFVAETISVAIQVSYFRLTKKRDGIGKRIFLMAPLHHHYEKKGWKETQVVVRFWIVTMILILVGIASLKIR